MNTPKPLLADLYRRGKPLADFYIEVRSDVVRDELIEKINTLAPDIQADPYYTRSIIMTGTKEAFQRVFGWRLVRVNAPKWVPELQKYDGFWDDQYLWEGIGIETLPPWLAASAIRVGLSQPGYADDGQADNITYPHDA